MANPPRAEAARRAVFDRLIDGHLRADRDADVETVLCTMTDDIEHEVLGATDNPARGKDAVRARYDERFANVAHDRDVPLRRLYGDSFVVDERIWEGRVTGRVGPFVGGGRRVSQRVLQIFVIRDGQVARQTVYSDITALMYQLT